MLTECSANSFDDSELRFKKICSECIWEGVFFPPSSLHLLPLSQQRVDSLAGDVGKQSGELREMYSQSFFRLPLNRLFIL